MEDPLAPLLPCERKPRLRRLQHTACPHKILRGVSGRGLAIVGSIKRPLRRPRASSAASAVLDASGAALLRSACGRMQDAQIARARGAMQHTEACNPPNAPACQPALSESGARPTLRLWTAGGSRRSATMSCRRLPPSPLFPPPLRGITIVIPRSHSIFTAATRRSTRCVPGTSDALVQWVLLQFAINRLGIGVQLCVRACRAGVSCPPFRSPEAAHER